MKKTKKIKKMLIGVTLVAGGIIIGQYLPNMKSQQSVPKSGVLAMYIENESGEYDLSSQTSFPTNGYVLNTEKSTCKNGGTISQDSKTKKLSVSVSNKDECTVYFDKELSKFSIDLIIESSNGVRTSFDDPATTDEGIFEMEDDYGTSYYYRGAIENNYVKYGVNASGQEMWWRIIRVNGDGSLRIVYDGTQGYENGTDNENRFAITNQSYNTQTPDAKYVGWMYGPTGTTASTSREQAQSNIESVDAKKAIDQWYKKNIVDTGYGNNLSDEIFCNDRSTPGKELTGAFLDTGLGYGYNVTYYGAYARFNQGGSSSENYNNPQPTFKCLQKNDAFTVSDTQKGNGALTYPVGLITADEIVAAGSGKYYTINQDYYLFKSSRYRQWSLSSFYFSNKASMFYVSNSGQLGYSNDDNTSGAIAPVINLSPEYANRMVGTGTITDPYRAA